MRRPIGSLMLAGLMGMFKYSDRGERNRLTPKQITVTPKETPIPKGCKKYEFVNESGTFECIAINKKNALRKYNRWKEKMNTLQEALLK